MRKNYFPLVDLSRFAAALLVLIYHLGYTTWQERSSGYFIHGGLYSIPEMTWASLGFVGVQIFFVISGFVIANSAANATIAQFAIGRATRIFPALWICATITLIACLSSDLYSTKQLIRRFAASIVLFPISPWMEGVYWTLILEVVFYTMIAGLIIFGKFSKIDLLAKTLTVYSGVAICLSLAAHSIDSSLIQSLVDIIRGKRQILAWHGVFFAMGVYFYLWSVDKLTRSGLFFSAITLALCCLQIYVATAFPRRAGSDEVAQLEFGFHAWAPPILTFLLFTAIIPLSIRFKGFIHERLPTKITQAFRTLGLMSYPIYLVHFTLGVLLIRTMVIIGLSPLIALAMSSIFIIFISFLIAKYFEPIVQRWTKERLLAIHRVALSRSSARNQ